MRWSVLTRRQAQHLRNLILRYKSTTRFPASWRQRTDEDLWTEICQEIGAVGNARAGFVIKDGVEARRQMSLRRLRRFASDAELLRHISWVLRSIRSRYVGTKDRNWKSEAILRNFRAWGQRGALEQFFADIAKQKHESARIDALRKLKGYGPKTARDTAIKLGLATNCLALDSRIKNILTEETHPRKPSLDYGCEKGLLKQIVPRGMTGAEADRVLFQNYDKIMADIRLTRNR